MNKITEAIKKFWSGCNPAVKTTIVAFGGAAVGVLEPAAVAFLVPYIAGGAPIALSAAFSAATIHSAVTAGAISAGALWIHKPGVSQLLESIQSQQAAKPEQPQAPVAQPMQTK